MKSSIYGMNHSKRYQDELDNNISLVVDKREEAQGIKVRAARLGVDISHCLSLAEAKETCTRAALIDEIEANAIVANLAVAELSGIDALNYRDLCRNDIPRPDYDPRTPQQRALDELSADEAQTRESVRP